jgi:lipopolysaccharide export LptBFGC system permease protein LptF
MPRLLYRFMIADLLRMAGLTCAVLLIVISFGAAIKPLSNNSLLSAAQVLKYILLATVPMLQYALPFAAGFAGTMSLHRMTSTNEILAAAASGISYRRLLTPVLLIGVGLTIVMAVLTNNVIPRFWVMLERTVAEDITRLFQVTIERGEPFVYGDLEVYADEVREIPNPAGSSAETRLVLTRVAAALLDDDGGIDEDVTARQAIVDVYRREGATILSMSMVDVAAYQHDTGTLARTARIEPPPRVIPSVLQDDPKRLTRKQLWALDENPDEFGRVVGARHDLIEALRDAELMYRIDQELGASGRVELEGQEPGRRIVVFADRLAGNRLRASEGRPRIVQYDEDVATHEMRARSMDIRQREVGPLGTVAVDLVLADYEVTDLRSGMTNRRQGVTVENLVFDHLDADDLLELPTPALLERVDGSPAPRTKRLDYTYERLQRKIRQLRREIRSRTARRYALSATVLLLLMLGTTLAIWLRESLPLTIYLWAFLPSILNLILIESGQHVMREGAMVTGSAVMWSGNAFILLIWWYAYYRLSRN